MATMNVSLPDLMKDWAEEQAKTDRYGNVSDYIRDLIRRDQEKQEWVARMRGLIQEGLDSGVSNRSMADIRAAARAKLGLPADEA